MHEIGDGPPEEMPALRVYIAQHRPMCREALQVVDKIKRRFAELDV